MTSGNVLKALEMLDPGFRMNASNLAGSNPNAIPDFQMRGQASMGNYQSDDVVVLRGDDKYSSESTVVRVGWSDWRGCNYDHGS